MTKAKDLVALSAKITSLSVGRYAYIRDINSIDTPRLLPPIIGICHPSLSNNSKAGNRLKKTKLIYSEESHSINPNFTDKSTYLFINAQDSDSMYWDIIGYYNVSEIEEMEENIGSPTYLEFKKSREEYIEAYLLKRDAKNEKKDEIRKKLIGNIPSKLTPLYNREKHLILYLQRYKTDRDKNSRATAEIDEMDFIESTRAVIYDTVSAQQILESPWLKMIAIINYHGWVIPIPMIYLYEDND